MKRFMVIRVSRRGIDAHTGQNNDGEEINGQSPWAHSAAIQIPAGDYLTKNKKPDLQNVEKKGARD